MFELSLTNEKKSSFISNSEDKYGFNKDIHKDYHFEDEYLCISGLSYLDENNDTYNNDDFIVLLVGKVFYQLEYDLELLPVSAYNVLNNFLEEGELFLNKLKGNFIIVIYNKEDRKLFTAKDQLGLKYLYYKTVNNNFYISTNLNDFKRIDFVYNYSAILEKILFFVLYQVFYIDKVQHVV